MTDTKIEIIAAEDECTLARCLKIRETVFIIEKNVPKEIEVDSSDCLNGACEHFLILCGGADAGAFRCSRTNGNAVRLQRLCVLKEFRAHGVGKAALEFLESRCRKDGFSAIELDAKLDASPFYEKCGYKKVSEPFIEAGIPHVKMKKEVH